MAINWSSLRKVAANACLSNDCADGPLCPWWRLLSSGLAAVGYFQSGGENTKSGGRTRECRRVIISQNDDNNDAFLVIYLHLALSVCPAAGWLAVSKSGT